MPAPYEPKTDDAGLLDGDVFVLTTQPLAYTPCKNEFGVVVDGKFIPFDSQLQYDYHSPNEESFPQLVTAVPIDREPPYVPQTTMCVAPPAITPYSWTPVNPWNGGTNGTQSGNVDNTKSRRTVLCDTISNAIATAEEKALPGYVANPGIRILSQTHWDFMTSATTASVTAGHLIYGEIYTIINKGNTDWVNIGASANTVGVSFMAIGPGVGTGTARLTIVDVNATALSSGSAYEIKTPGDTDWTTVGAADSEVGTVFWATGAGTGTGVATRLTYDYDGAVGLGYIWDFMPSIAQIIWTKTSPTSGIWQIKTPSPADVILWGYTTTPTTPYVAGGYELSPITGSSQAIYFKINGGPLMYIRIYKVYASNTAPESFDYHITADGDVAVEAVRIEKDAWYKIYIPGTTSWTSIGAANNNSGTYFKATNSGTGTGTAKRVEPHPLLRTGQTRYPVNVEKVGIDYDGTPFIPTSPVTGVLRLCAYRYGLILSMIGDYLNSYTTEFWVRLKIGKASASWDKSTKELTFIGDQDYTFLYSANGTAPATEEVSLTIEPTETAGAFLVGGSYKIKDPGDTDFTLIGAANNDAGTVFTATGVGVGSGTAELQAVTITWKATRGCMEDSDTWETVITCHEYEDPGTHAKTWVLPDDFTTAYFSTTPRTYPNTPVQARMQFQRRPDWYITPDGTGDGKTPDEPSDALTIIGTQSAPGLAYGSRWIDMGWDTDTKKFTLTKNSYTSVPAGIVIKYKLAPSYEIIEATELVAGATYIILTPGDTIWTDFGALDNNIGTSFIATGPGTGTGEAIAEGAFPTPWETYSTAVSVTTPSKALFKLVLADDTDFTRNFLQPLPLGDSNINAIWNKTLQTLTFICDFPETELWYADNTTDTPVTKYTEPIYLPIQAGNFVVGTEYKIYSVGNTDFTKCGSTDNNIGTVFTATSQGAGTGEATKTEAVTYAVRAYHIASQQPWDITTMTLKVECDPITPHSTDDFTQNIAVVFTHFTFATQSNITGGYHIQQGDIIWASEGTYTSPTGSATTYFYKPADCTLMGGYNTDFIERDVMNQKTVFKAVTWNGGTEINNKCISLSSVGIIDGCWNDSEMREGAGVNSLVPDMEAAQFNNCHVDIEITTANSRPLTASFFGGFNSNGTTNCSVKLVISRPGGGTTSCGGSFRYGVNCDSDIDVTHGNAPANTENGVNVGAISIGGMQKMKVRCGNGGTSAINNNGARAFVGVSAGGDYVDIDAVCGNGGQGKTVLGTSSCAATVIGSSFNDVPLKVRTTCGNGYATTSTIAFTVWAGWGVNPKIHRLNMDAVAVAGNASYPASPSSAVADAHVTIPAYLSNNSPYAGMYRPRLVGSATCGTGTTQRGYLDMLFYGPPNYDFKPWPMYIQPGDLEFTEGVPWGVGVPTRVDHAAGWTIGWYSGKDNGDGAPLAGYETPQGTGVALGSYWE